MNGMWIGCSSSGSDVKTISNSIRTFNLRDLFRSSVHLLHDRMLRQPENGFIDPTVTPKRYLFPIYWHSPGRLIGWISWNVSFSLSFPFFLNPLWAGISFQRDNSMKSHSFEFQMNSWILFNVLSSPLKEMSQFKSSTLLKIYPQPHWTLYSPSANLEWKSLLKSDKEYLKNHKIPECQNANLTSVFHFKNPSKPKKKRQITEIPIKNPEKLIHFGNTHVS